MDRSNAWLNTSAKEFVPSFMVDSQTFSPSRPSGPSGSNATINPSVSSNAPKESELRKPEEPREDPRNVSFSQATSSRNSVDFMNKETFETLKPAEPMTPKQEEAAEDAEREIPEPYTEKFPFAHDPKIQSIVDLWNNSQWDDEQTRRKDTERYPVEEEAFWIMVGRDNMHGSAEELLNDELVKDQRLFWFPEFVSRIPDEKFQPPNELDLVHLSRQTLDKINASGKKYEKIPKEILYALVARDQPEQTGELLRPYANVLRLHSRTMEHFGSSKDSYKETVRLIKRAFEKQPSSLGFCVDDSEIERRVEQETEQLIIAEAVRIFLDNMLEDEFKTKVHSYINRFIDMLQTDFEDWFLRVSMARVFSQEDHRIRELFQTVVTKTQFTKERYFYLATLAARVGNRTVWNDPATVQIEDLYTMDVAPKVFEKYVEMAALDNLPVQVYNCLAKDSQNMVFFRKNLVSLLSRFKEAWEAKMINRASVMDLVDKNGGQIVDLAPSIEKFSWFKKYQCERYKIKYVPLLFDMDEDMEMIKVMRMTLEISLEEERQKEELKKLQNPLNHSPSFPAPMPETSTTVQDRFTNFSSPREFEGSPRVTRIEERNQQTDPYNQMFPELRHRNPQTYSGYDSTRGQWGQSSHQSSPSQPQQTIHSPLPSGSQSDSYQQPRAQSSSQTRGWRPNSSW